MKTLAIVVTNDAFDKILTPLGIAYLMAAEDVQVDMLFVNWAVTALKTGGASNLHIDGGMPWTRKKCVPVWPRRDCRPTCTN